ncbi:MAG: hypothetical protein OEZ68_11680 [Gammaproteobacteria bacterium]|nr:hypothetical protein [Gammaproteobacteria bacterium]MDH5801454.1 hypothetical protein [Gammaproteobacteria bacterium]
MNCPVPGCMGNYDFEHISYYAKKRFVEGCDTVSLLSQARTDKEKEEIALVCLLDVDDDVVRDIQLTCKHADSCVITDCRERLRQMIDSALIEKR